MKPVVLFVVSQAYADPVPDSCFHCEATWYNGELTGDKGCFEGTIEGEKTDLPCCETTRLKIVRDGEVLYNILRESGEDDHTDDHHEHDHDIRVTAYKFRQCNSGYTCTDYFDIYPDIDQEKCKSNEHDHDHRQAERLRNNKNARVQRLVNKFFGEKEDQAKSCPYCFAASHHHDHFDDHGHDEDSSYDEYHDCALKPSGQEMKSCPAGQDSCVIDYFHYADDDHITCEVGRDCYPAAYIGLDQTMEESECHTDDCNNHQWLPWLCETHCGDEITKCILGCLDDQSCHSQCLREYDECLEKC